jgi:hypothetical protein
VPKRFSEDKEMSSRTNESNRRTNEQLTRTDDVVQQANVERITKEIYESLGVLGINVVAVKNLNLSFNELEYFYLKVMYLVDRDAGWMEVPN